eukprot:5979588-Pleurochrysis_carterae.AAC.1
MMYAPQEQCSYKYLLNSASIGYANKFKYLLLCGSVVIYVQVRPYEPCMVVCFESRQTMYVRVRRYVHCAHAYVPARDLWFGHGVLCP